MYDGHMMGWGGGFMWLFWIFLIVAILWIIRAAVGGPSATPKSAREILEERYARGEIDKEEFEQKRKDLTS